MQNNLLSGQSSGWIIIIWIAVAIFSAVSSSRKKHRAERQMQERNPAQPFYGSHAGGDLRPFSQQQMQWDMQKIQQQTAQYAEETLMDENQYSREEEFRQQKYEFRQEVPVENVEEFVYEYVPEEFGEAGANPVKDQFYHSAEIKNALQDEQDLARERAYRRKTEDAFKKVDESSTKVNRLFGGKGTLKRAILLSEVLGAPKSMQ